MNDAQNQIALIMDLDFSPQKRTLMDTAGIGTPETISISDLNTFHQNPRVGNVEEIATSLEVNGQYKPLVVNRGSFTNRPMEVLAGNHTLKAMRLLVERDPDETRFTTADCWVVDVDDDRANRIVLTDNRTADIGSYDNEALLGLLETMEDDLDGTGYTEDYLELIKDVSSEAPSLDELEAEYGEQEEDDFWVTIRLRVPPVLLEQWKDWANPYDSDEEAFEALLDKSSGYGG